jgi:hypothetical protein
MHYPQAPPSPEFLIQAQIGDDKSDDAWVIRGIACQPVECFVGDGCPSTQTWRSRPLSNSTSDGSAVTVGGARNAVNSQLTH